MIFEPNILDGMVTLFPELRKPLEIITAQTEAISFKGETHDKIQRLLLSMRGITLTDRLPFMMELIIAMSDVSGVRQVGRDNALDRIGQRCENALWVYAEINSTTLDVISEPFLIIKSRQYSHITYLRMTFNILPKLSQP